MMNLKVARFAFVMMLGLMNTKLALGADNSQVVELPTAVRQAVSIWNINFKPFSLSDYPFEIQTLFTNLSREAPMRVIADFNGDQVDDYALLGEANGQQFLIVVASGRQFRVVQVETWSDRNFKTTIFAGLKSKITGVPVYISKGAGSFAEVYRARHHRDSIQLETYLGPVRLFSIRGSKARELKPE